jgi:hypothetical protein
MHLNHHFWHLSLGKGSISFCILWDVFKLWEILEICFYDDDRLKFNSLFFLRIPAAQFFKSETFPSLTLVLPLFDNITAGSTFEQDGRCIRSLPFNLFCLRRNFYLADWTKFFYVLCFLKCWFWVDVCFIYLLIHPFVKGAFMWFSWWMEVKQLTSRFLFAWKKKRSFRWVTNPSSWAYFYILKIKYISIDGWIN